MRTIKEAAAVLARLQSPADIALILPALGFSGNLEELDSESTRALGVNSLVGEALIARGSGTLRALVVRANSTLAVRDTTRKLAERLSRGSPHILWLLFVLHPPTRTLALAAWTSEPRRSTARTSALIVELDHVVDSDAETLCSLAAVRDSVDVLAHSRWVELLGRDALTRRFYRTLEQIVRSMSDALRSVSHNDDRDELALLQVSRLLFLSFLEAKGWLDEDRGFLSRTFNDCMSRGGDYHRRVLLPLLFGTLNTPFSRRATAARSFGRLPFLNGGLFARTATEKANSRAWLPDEQYGDLFGLLLTRYRYTAREDSSTWSEAAIDPEMLGKAFESLMLLRARHASGAFYTPQLMVERVTHSTLLDALCAKTALQPEHVDAALRGIPVGDEASHTLSNVARGLRVLDPACGSGAFLVHALEKLAALLITTGDRRSVPVVRRGVLAQSIFGVDINPIAVWLCELRLWLSIVIDSDESDPCKVPPLPNLDHNVRVGDSLSGGDVLRGVAGTAESHTMRNLRERYMRSTGNRKRHLSRVLDEQERKRAIAVVSERLRVVTVKRIDIVASERSKDLFGERAHQRHSRLEALSQLREQSRRLRAARRQMERGGALPFSFQSHFPDACAAAGFDIVLGNPPWVRLERIPAEARAVMRRDFDVFRLPPWEPSVQNKRGPGFAPQVDLAALFVERSLALVRDGGTVALILPAKLWRSIAGSGLRQLLTRDAAVRELEDWSESSPAFDAVVYPSVLIVRRRCDGPRGTENMGSGFRRNDKGVVDSSIHGNDKGVVDSSIRGNDNEVMASVHERDTVLRWSVARESLAFDASPGAPWIIIPAEVRESFNVLSRAGIAFGDSQLGPPRLGVKCGYNNAFIVHLQSRDAGSALVRSGSRTGRVECELLRPLLRGESVQSWSTSAVTQQIIWTHGSDSLALPTLPPFAKRWFNQWRLDLAHRADLKDGMRWWSLFRTDSAAADRWRVVWPDISRAPRATVLAPSDPSVPLNSCYVALLPDETDALTLAALLNSSICAAWLNVLAEQARGGYRRYLAWTVSLLPLPLDWSRARRLLAPIGERAMSGHPPCCAELLDAVLQAYGLKHERIAALLTWNSR